MTPTTLSCIMLSIICSLLSHTVFASDHTSKNQAAPTSTVVHTTGGDQSLAGKTIPISADAHSNTPHTEKQVPQMEELPHIHKFHKERVKKIKKHHSKYWLLSQVLLALCHISILIIGFLHATH